MQNMITSISKNSKIIFLIMQIYSLKTDFSLAVTWNKQ